MILPLRILRIHLFPWLISVAAMEDINLNKTDLPYVDFLICMPYLPMLRTKMVVDNDMIILFNGTIESDS